MTVAHIDFETRSTIDLPKTGAYIYAMHPTTDVWCMAYAFDDQPVQLWTPGNAFPAELAEHIRSGGICIAHNAAFERVIFEYVMPRYHTPSPNLKQWRCTMAMAYAMALPGSLEEAAAAVGLQQQKDMAGRRLMLQMSRPRRQETDCLNCNGNGIFYSNVGPACTCLIWWDDDDRKQRLYAYCKQDIEVERMLEKRLMQLRPQEQQIWHLDQQINDRGVYIDKELCEKAMLVVDKAEDVLDREMKAVTGGMVKKCSEVSNLMKFLHDNFYFPASLDKESISEMLGTWDLIPEVRRALEIRQEGGKTSVAKISKMLTMRADDGRMRGNLQYHGAGTGRWAARGAQLQNLPRPAIKDVPDAIETLLKLPDPGAISILHGPPLSVVSDCIRGMIAAPEGFDIVAADFSNIEGRVVAWLAGEELKLNAFRAYDNGSGPDIYLVAASGIFGVPIAEAKPYRQIGKVAELSLGYQGGPAAFGKMSGNYGLKIGEHYDVIWSAARAEHKQKALDGYEQRGAKSDMSKEAWLAAEVIKVAWRDSNWNIVQSWYAYENAAIEAVQNPGATVAANQHVSYKVSGSFLWCRLPSGRVLCYPYPKIKEVETDWGKKHAIVYKTVDGYTRKWGEKAFYGGLACENITQAVARDIMAEAMLRVDAAGYRPTITIHDEIVCEVPEDFGSETDFERLMVHPPVWSKGCPISAESWRGKRYRK